MWTSEGKLMFVETKTPSRSSGTSAGGNARKTMFVFEARFRIGLMCSDGFSPVYFAPDDTSTR